MVVLQKNLKSALSSQLRLSIEGGAVAQPGSQSHNAIRRQQVSLADNTVNETNQSFSCKKICMF